MTLNKADLMNSVSEKMERQKQKATSVVESLLELIKHTLESGEDILISGFGKLCVKDKAVRKGRNPQTGENTMLRPRRVVRFKHSLVLREKMHSKNRS
jgi:integration host factor subunit alpha